MKRNKTWYNVRERLKKASSEAPSKTTRKRSLRPRGCALVCKFDLVEQECSLATKTAQVLCHKGSQKWESQTGRCGYARQNTSRDPRARSIRGNARGKQTPTPTTLKSKPEEAMCLAISTIIRQIFFFFCFLESEFPLPKKPILFFVCVFGVFSRPSFSSQRNPSSFFCPKCQYEEGGGKS